MQEGLHRQSLQHDQLGTQEIQLSRLLSALKFEETEEEWAQRSEMTETMSMGTVAIQAELSLSLTISAMEDL